METWNRLIAEGGENRRENGGRKGEELVKEYVGMTHGHGQQRGTDCGLEGWAGWRRAKGKNGTNVIE